MSLGYALLSLSTSPDMYWNPLCWYHRPILNGLGMAGCGGLPSTYPMSEPKFPKKLNACLNAILAEEWGFLDNP